MSHGQSVGCVRVCMRSPKLFCDSLPCASQYLAVGFLSLDQCVCVCIAMKSKEMSIQEAMVELDWVSCPVFSAPLLCAHRGIRGFFIFRRHLGGFGGAHLMGRVWWPGSPPPGVTRVTLEVVSCSLRKSSTISTRH